METHFKGKNAGRHSCDIFYLNDSFLLRKLVLNDPWFFIYINLYLFQRRAGILIFSLLLKASFFTLISCTPQEVQEHSCGIYIV